MPYFLKDEINILFRGFFGWGGGGIASFKKLRNDILIITYMLNSNHLAKINSLFGII